ncbi:unnamed protein product, partial [Brenthis ino]
MKAKRQQAYKNLLDSYNKKYRANLSMDLLKKKIQNMTFIYKREKNKYLSARAKGEEYSTPIWYYDLISFIDSADNKDSTDLTTSRKNEDQESSVCNDEYVEFEDEDRITSKPESEVVYLLNHNDNKVTSNQTSRENIESEAISFGRTIGLQLQELNTSQRIIAEKLISDTIFNARLHKLTTNSCIKLE